ncbi:MAG: arginase [Sphingobacteriales bacterium]|jgi:arginase
MRDVKIIEVKSELGAGTRGASLGIDAIQIASMDFSSLFFKNFTSIQVETENRLLLEKTLHPYAKKIDGIITMYERISETVSVVIEEGSFPIILSGDHSNAGGTLAGLKKAYPKSRIGAIWIDAHADLHSPYTTPTGHVHGMPLATALNEDNLSCKINNISADTKEHWETLKAVGIRGPKIKHSDIVFVSVRDTEEPEDVLIKKHAIPNFTTDELRRVGVEKVAKMALKHLSGCDKIYVSFDVDCLDPSISKGTGTPVPDGITEKEAGSLVTRLLENEKVCCFEITEVNPTLDKENLMAENAFELLVKATNKIVQG